MLIMFLQSHEDDHVKEANIYIRVISKLTDSSRQRKEADELRVSSKGFLSRDIVWRSQSATRSPQHSGLP